MSEFAEHLPRESPGPGLPAGLRVRAAGAGDVGGMARILAAREGGEIGTHAAGFRRELERHSGSEGHLLLVAELRGEVVAFARARRFEPPEDAPPDCAPGGYYLAGVVVDPAHRRLGIAARLTEERLAWVAGHADEVFYVSNVRNSVSLDLHARFGFVELTREFTYPGVTFEGGVGVLGRLSLG